MNCLSGKCLIKRDCAAVGTNIRDCLPQTAISIIENICNGDLSIAGCFLCNGCKYIFQCGRVRCIKILAMLYLFIGDGAAIAEILLTCAGSNIFQKELSCWLFGIQHGTCSGNLTAKTNRVNGY